MECNEKTTNHKQWNAIKKLTQKNECNEKIK
jgi:hypothetical protein